MFRHAEVSSRGKERETSSQKVTSARPYAFGWTWGHLERSCAMMRSFKGIETVHDGALFSALPGILAHCFNALKRPHHGTTPLQAPPRPSKGTRPGRGFLLRRSFTFLSPSGHLGVPKHAPPSTTRKAAEDARVQKKKRDKGNHSPSEPSERLLIHKA